MIATSIKNRIASGKAWVDVLAIVALLLLHPVLYNLDSSRGYFPPDAVLYMTFAENFLAKGLLYVTGSAAESGTILPPLYPLLMLICNFFVDDFLISSELVSSVAVIAVSFISYLIIRQLGNPFYAFLGALAIQLTYQLNLWAITPLTEATFILILAVSLWVALRVIRTKGPVWLFALGAMLALVFFTRQVGIILVPFFLLVAFFAVPRRFHYSPLILLAGLALFLVPYMLILHSQGNRIGADLSAFEQHWSTGKGISVDSVDKSTLEYVRSIRNTPVNNYEDAYVKRRLLRQLLPDSTAMLSQINFAPQNDVQTGINKWLTFVWNSRNGMGERLLFNAKILYETMGNIVFVAFFITLLTPLLIGRKREALLSRYLIGGFVLYYLIALSVLTGLIDRYVTILAPFVLLHIFREVASLLSNKTLSIRGWSVAPLFFLAAISMCVLTLPKNYSDVQSRPKGTLEQMGESNFRQFIGQGEPVFSIGPYHAYVAGGTWRALPNDSLEKIAKYAAHTGVRWMIVVHKPQPEVSAYKLAKNWYLDKSLLREYRHLVNLRAVSRDSQSFLFEFKAGK
jgi:4-amino-4-deoxy-L-arabinose transferase-like glycosyltransferase